MNFGSFFNQLNLAQEGSRPVPMECRPPKVSHIKFHITANVPMDLYVIKINFDHNPNEIIWERVYDLPKTPWP